MPTFENATTKQTLSRICLCVESYNFCYLEAFAKTLNHTTIPSGISRKCTHWARKNKKLKNTLQRILDISDVGVGTERIPTILTCVKTGQKEKTMIYSENMPKIVYYIRIQVNKPF